MFRRSKKLISFGIALTAALEAAVSPAFAAGGAPITHVALENVNTRLTVGAVPEYTAYLTGDCVQQASILNEGWGCAEDMNVHVTSSAGDPIPETLAGSPYVYLTALQAKEGWYFAEGVTLTYEGVDIPSSAYTASVAREGDALILICNFIPEVVPLAPDAVPVSEVRVEGAVMEYAAGDEPVFTAQPGEPACCLVKYERWMDAFTPDCAVSSSEAFNALTGVTEENRLRRFEADRSYSYDLCLTPAYGYVFADDAVVYVNGTEYVPFAAEPDKLFLKGIAELHVQAAATETAPVTEEPPVTETEPVTETAAENTQKQYTVVPAELNPDLFYGDVNQDGRLSIADAVLLMHYLTEDGAFPLPDAGLAAGDLDLDGQLTVMDVGLLIEKLLNAEDTVTVPALQPISDETESPLPQLPVPDWMLPVTGNSAAFTEEPIDGLTVSAEENVLDYDGQLKFRTLNDEEAKTADAVCADYGIVVDGWHVDAGLAPDEHLPGNYQCSYDLSRLGLPESLYDSILIQRVADDGTVTEYATEREGSVLRWESDQNSVVYVIVGTLVLVLPWTVREMKEKAGKRGSAVSCYKTSQCAIYYEDIEAPKVKEERQGKIAAIESAARKEAREYAEEKVSDAWSGIAGLFWNYAREVNRHTAIRMNEILSQNDEYKELMAVENGHPADVIMLGEIYRIAQRYLKTQEGCPAITGKPDVLFVTEIEADGEGEAVTPYILGNYLVIHRTREGYANTNRDPKAEDSGYFGLYDNPVPSATADSLLTTMTHEMYHLTQAKKINMNTAKNLKFFEMSAMIVEHRCAEYYEKEGYRTNTYSEVVSKCYDTFGVSIDHYSGLDNTLLTSAGYTLSGFWEYVSKYMNRQFTGWELICGYTQYGTITATMNNLFGFTLAVAPGENKNKILDEFWESYQRSIAKEALSLAGEDMGRTKDGDSYFPTQMRKITLNPERPSALCFVKVKNDACTLVGVQNAGAAKDDAWSAVMVRNQNFGELQPQHQFLLPNNAKGEPIGKESRNGLVFNAVGPTFYYRELQKTGALSTSGYRAYFLPAPEAPDVQFSEEEEQFTVRLKSPRYEGNKQNLTDCFLLCFTANGKEIFTKEIPFDEWEEEIVLNADEVHLNINEPNALKITVCEYIREEGDCPACRTASSKPFEMDIGQLKFRNLNAECRVSGSYGSVVVSGDGTFTLDEKGNFSLHMKAESGSAGIRPTDPDAPIHNPFYDGYTEWSYSGFTVTGKVQEAESTEAWIAPIKTATPKYSASTHDESIALVLSDSVQLSSASVAVNAGDIIKTDSYCSGSFEGAPSGTLEYRESDGYILVNMSLDVPMANNLGEQFYEKSVRVSARFPIPE